MTKKIMMAICALATSLAMAFETVGYDASLGKAGEGDLYLPSEVSGATRVFLNIHGGGWSALSRHDARGISEFLAANGCAVYNIDYRLAAPATPWPACGEDCLKAAKFILGGGLAKYGLTPKSIYLIGASAGGHLAVWTGLSLPPSQVAGIVDISGIADPNPDFKAHPGRYRSLFGGRQPTAADLDAINVVKLVRAGCPRLLMTHAKEDQVVPIASATGLAVAYSAVGGEVDYVQYSAKDEPNLGGHCIWRLGEGKRLIDRIEQSILRFIGCTGVDVMDYRGEDYARAMASDGWRVAFLNNGPNFGKVTYQERHLKSDEIFVLLEGEATLVLDDDHHRLPLERGRIYNVRRGTWHQIETTGKVLVFENNDTTSNNSETRPL